VFVIFVKINLLTLIKQIQNVYLFIFMKFSNASVYREFIPMVDNSYISNGFSI